MESRSLALLNGFLRILRLTNPPCEEEAESRKATKAGQRGRGGTASEEEVASLANRGLSQVQHMCNKATAEIAMAERKTEVAEGKTAMAELETWITQEEKAEQQRLDDIAAEELR